jgi:hypothetical protein
MAFAIHPSPLSIFATGRESWGRPPGAQSPQGWCLQPCVALTEAIQASIDSAVWFQPAYKAINRLFHFCYWAGTATVGFQQPSPTLAPLMQPGCGKIRVNDLQQAWLETN